MTVPIPRSDAVRELLRGSRDTRGGRARGNPLECLAGYRRIGLDFLLGAFDCAFRHFLRALFLQLGQATFRVRIDMCSRFTGTNVSQCGQKFDTGIRLSCVSVAAWTIVNRSASVP